MRLNAKVYNILFLLKYLKGKKVLKKELKMIIRKEPYAMKMALSFCIIVIYILTTPTLFTKTKKKCLKKILFYRRKKHIFAQRQTTVIKMTSINVKKMEESQGIGVVYDISLDGTFVNALGMNVVSNTDG